MQLLLLVGAVEVLTVNPLQIVEVRLVVVAVAVLLILLQILLKLEVLEIPPQ
jgi:hypothetical protein